MNHSQGLSLIDQFQIDDAITLKGAKSENCNSYISLYCDRTVYLENLLFLLSLENLSIFRFITMRVLKFPVKASILAIPWGYHDPKNVHFPPVNEDTCSPGSENPMMGGHDRCRGTLVFPLSELFVEGVKLPLKVKKAI